MSRFLDQLKLSSEKALMPQKYYDILRQFYSGYDKALSAEGVSEDDYQDVFLTYLELVEQQCAEPFLFQPYHERVLKPFDHYKFGLDFVRPLVDLPHSTIHGKEHLKEIVKSLENGDNAIFLANHQTEADPQAISVMLENLYPKLGEEMIFVAGERVITDPVAVPISMGRNLLCIYSKRYIDNPPEQKHAKQLHNKRTMELMSQLLSEGGKAIYVAPSGGRDRRNADGEIEVAPFDPQSIEMLNLMAQRAGHPTYFYPLALKTYELLPPPETIQVELGEERKAQRTAIHLGFGPKIDMEHFLGVVIKDKHERRQKRAEYIWNLVRKDYATFT